MISCNNAFVLPSFPPRRFRARSSAVDELHAKDWCRNLETPSDSGFFRSQRRYFDELPAEAQALHTSNELVALTSSKRPYSQAEKVREVEPRLPFCVDMQPTIGNAYWSKRKYFNSVPGETHPLLTPNGLAQATEKAKEAADAPVDACRHSTTWDAYFALMQTDKGILPSKRRYFDHLPNEIDPLRTPRNWGELKTGKTGASVVADTREPASLPNNPLPGATKTSCARDKQNAGGRWPPRGQTVAAHAPRPATAPSHLRPSSIHDVRNGSGAGTEEQRSPQQCLMLRQAKTVTLLLVPARTFSVSTSAIDETDSERMCRMDAERDRQESDDEPWMRRWNRELRAASPPQPEMLHEFAPSSFINDAEDDASSEQTIVM